MEVVRKPFALEFTGPLPQRDMPENPMYDLELAFQHEAEEPVAALRQHLDEMLGEPTVRRWPLLGTTVTWKGKWRIQAKIRDGQIVVRSLHRLKGKRLTDLCAALSGVPGARNLVLKAETPDFVNDFHDITACTPCQAAKLRTM